MSEITTTIRDFEALANAVRAGRMCIPASGFDPADKLLPDPTGLLVAEGDTLELRLRSSHHASRRPSARAKFTTADDHDDIFCVLDGHLEVVLETVREGSSSSHSLIGKHYRYGFNAIKCKDVELRKDAAADVRITARIARSALVFKNVTRQTTCESSLGGEPEVEWKLADLGGEFGPYTYTISEVDEDLEIRIRLREGETSPSPNHDQRFFDAVLWSFVWLNGGHPHPYYFEHRRDGVFVDSCIRPLRASPHPKTRLMASNPDGETLDQFFRASIAFFMAEENPIADVRDFLWQYRDATDGGSVTMGMLLQACTLLEGITGLVLRHTMGLSRNKIDKLALPDGTRKGRAEARFRHVSDHFGLPWDNKVEHVISVWKELRNALAHGSLREFIERPDSNYLRPYSQIIQLFNVFALRMIGYTGAVHLDDHWFALRSNH